MDFAYLSESFTHIVDKILGYVNNTAKGSLTCKDFYQSICRNEEFKKTLVINGGDVKDNYNSIMKSGRKFKELRLQNLSARRDIMSVYEILVTLGATVKEVAIYDCTFHDVGQLVDILNFMPQLKTLSIAFVNIKNRPGKADQTLSLPSLKTLHFLSEHLSSSSSLDLLALLPVGVLQDVRISGSSFFMSHLTFFMSQSNTKKLEICVPGQIQSIHNLQLEELTVRYPSHEIDTDLNNFVRTQPGLLKLIVQPLIEISTAVNICAYLGNLKSLDIHIDEVSSQLMTNLANLKHLEELKLSLYEFNIDTFTLVQFPCLLKMTLFYIDLAVIDVAGLAAMQQAFPSLKEIGFSVIDGITLCDVLDIFINIESISAKARWDVAMAHLFQTTNLRPHNNIKSLSLTNFFLETFNIGNDFMRILCNMPKLQTLSIDDEINFDDHSMFLESSIPNLPALKKLELSLTLSEGFRVDRLVAAFNKLKKIKSVELQFLSCYPKPLMTLKNLLDEKFDEFKSGRVMVSEREINKYSLKIKK